MKTEFHLDHTTILANQHQPVHFAIRFEADTVAARQRKPAAFCIVMDRSGSMSGSPLTHARLAARTAVKNLRKDDHFALVVFDESANVIIPMQPAANKKGWNTAIDQIQPGGSTNLTGGWMLGAEELSRAPQDCARRLLLLSDGQLNHGIVEPKTVQGIVASGLERGGIRTACLGFGDQYDEELLGSLARATNGDFHDADSPEKLPAIFAHELEGLQSLAVQNLRVRLKQLSFCETLYGLNEYPHVTLPDGRIEVAVGDLVSEEERVVLFAMEVLPLPLIGGKPVADLQGEALVEVELVWDEITAEGIVSRSLQQTVRVQATQDAAEVKTNETVLSWVAVQRAARAIEEATRKAQEGDEAAARQCLDAELQQLAGCSSTASTAEAVDKLKQARGQLDEQVSFSRKAKSLKFMEMAARKSSSRRREP